MDYSDTVPGYLSCHDFDAVEVILEPACKIVNRPAIPKLRRELVQTSTNR